MHFHDSAPLKLIKNPTSSFQIDDSRTFQGIPGSLENNLRLFRTIYAEATDGDPRLTRHGSGLGLNEEDSLDLTCTRVQTHRRSWKNKKSTVAGRSGRMRGTKWLGKRYSLCKLTFPSRARTRFHRLSSADGHEGPQRAYCTHTGRTMSPLSTRGVD